MDNQIIEQAEVIWNYHRLNHDIFKDDFVNNVDGILVFGSSDISVADEAANVWLLTMKDRVHKGSMFPYLLFSGGMGTGPHSGCNLMGWTRPEAEIFSERVLSIIKDNVDPTHFSKLCLFVDNKARNSGENVDLSKKIIEENDLKSEKLIIVQKPFMERRTYATFKHRWPRPEIKLHSSSSTLLGYPKISNISLEEVIGIMLGDLQRITLYAPPYGNFQIAQEIPDEVWKAYKLLTENEKISKEHPKLKINLIKDNSDRIN